ncbi:MAG: hypothetical protein FVQ77_13835 [Cytophagales bacterium]|nr:hypothetical protein [Cytophagales bacterium]
MINRKLYILLLSLSIVFIFTACSKLEYDKNLTFQDIKANMPETLDENLVEKHLILSGEWKKMPVDSFGFTYQPNCPDCPPPTGYDTVFHISISFYNSGTSRGYIYFEVVPVLLSGRLEFNVPFYFENNWENLYVNRVGLKLMCSDSMFVLQRNDLMGLDSGKVNFSIFLDLSITKNILKTCYQIPFEVYTIREDNQMVSRGLSFVWLKNGADGDPACANVARLDDLIESCDDCGGARLRWGCF